MSTLLLQLALGQFGDVFYFVYKLIIIQQKNPLITLYQVLKIIILGVKLFAGTKILNHRNFDHQYHLNFRCYLIRS